LGRYADCYKWECFTSRRIFVEAGLRARGAVLVAPARGPEHFLEQARRALNLPAARAAGMRRRLVERVGRGLHFFDAARAAAELYLPALVVHDPRDEEVPWAHAEAIARAWRRSRLVAAPGDGHYRILASPGTLERVLDFAATLPRAASAA
jgi:pimeloyl-ACP methyl ester carboxylesterase